MASENLNRQFQLLEYEKLKDEQQKRIEFRDQMIYLTLGAIGTVFAFCLEKPQFNFALLILPFICLVLGWTYLTNDEKISSISSYLTQILLPKIDHYLPDNKHSLSDNWDSFIRRDKKRGHRKKFQLIIDLCIFCFSSIFSIVAFFVLYPGPKLYHYIITLGELILIIYLLIQFSIYSETTVNRTVSLKKNQQSS